MKKFIALSIVFMVLVGAGFAEVAVTGQVDAVVMPLQVVAPDGADALIGAGVGRPGNAETPRARIGVTASNDTEQVGINFKVRFFTTNNLTFDDFAEVWWKPIDPLKIEVGKFVNDTLRGKIGDDNWHNYTAKMKGPDDIFTRFNSGTAGFMFGITPIAPLFIGVSVPSVVQFTSTGLTTSYTYYEEKNDSWEPTTIGNLVSTYEKIQAGVGFTIENIGLVRAQYVGASYAFTQTTVDKNSFWTNPSTVRRIEAAFAFTGMQGLVIDVGGKIPLSFKNYDITDYTYDSNPESPKKGRVAFESNMTYQAPFQISLGAGFTADALDIKGRVDGQFAGNVKQDGGGEYNLGPDINVHLWPSYNLGFATAGLDVGFNFIGDSEQKSGGTTTTTKGGYKFGIGAWLKKAYGGASIKGGLALSMGEVNEKKLDTVFSLPVIFEYTF